MRDRRGQGAGPEPARPPEGAASVRPEPSPSALKTGDVAPPDATEKPPEPSLGALFLLLANSALFHLGEGPDAMGEATPVDLAQAQFSIDLLRVLREKTEGRRSPDESWLLDGLLYDLEMRFVRAARSR